MDGSVEEEHFVCVEGAVEKEGDVRVATYIAMGTIVVVVIGSVDVVAGGTPVRPLRG